MKKLPRSFLLCISFLQINPSSFAPPQTVVELSKKRIAEHIYKNYGMEASFDSNACTNQASYQLLATSILLKGDTDVFRGEANLSYQELLEGTKLELPLKLEKFSPRSILGRDENRGEEQSQFAWKKNFLAAGIITLGVIAAAAVVHSNQRGEPIKPTPSATAPILARHF